MFKKIRHIHFVGIGGSGMSGIAEVLLKLGYRVTGSDTARSAVVIRLESLGAKVFEGHKATNVAGADVVVTSTAIGQKNDEVRAAHKAGVPVIPRIEMLAEIARLKYTIAISGTHGKTTTTSLVGQILKNAGMDPTVVVGGRLKAVGTGGVLGAGDTLVAEADESDGSFLKLSPTIAVVTNIDNDHLDYYKTMDRLDDAFATFAQRVPFYGIVYLCAEDAGVRRILPRLTRRFATYGFNPRAALRATNVVLDEHGSLFTVSFQGKRLGEIRLPLSGRHNVLNALAATAVSLHLDVPFETIKAGLAAFDGVGRRIEMKGEANGVVVLDDYGHHPTEIKATISAVKGRYPKRRLFVLFQPHRYSRTKILAAEFAQVLEAAPKLALLPIYAASEKPLRGISSDSIRRRMKSKPAIWNSEEIQKRLAEELKPGDVLLTLGAGDVYKVGEAWLSAQNNLVSRLEQSVPSLVGRIKRDEPLARHSTWSIGGPAEAYVEVRTRAELADLLKACAALKTSVFFLGWGSNVLLPDEGLRGVVIRLRGEFEAIDFTDENVTVGAGVHLPRLAKASVERGLSGAEALAGVPGTVGGAMMTNAGTPRGVIGDVVESVDVIDATGKTETLNREQIHFAYRSSNLSGRWVVSAKLRLKKADGNTAKEKLQAELSSREKTQPLGTKNVGSVFRNPPNDFAARLIEAAGLKGKKVGAMRFSPKHANFIENTGGATAKEAVAMIRLAQETVREKFSVELHPEVFVVEQPRPIVPS